MSGYRIGLAFFYHESHSFSPLRTDLRAFARSALLHGDELMNNYEGTRTEVGGFLDALRGTEFRPVPLMAAAAVPAGQVTTEAYEQIRAEMLAALRSAGELDGLLLALHGAMVVDAYQDPETDLIEHIRSVRGAAFPIAVTLDLHANLTNEFFEQDAICFGFQTYPHVDAYEQGVRAAVAMIRHLRGEAGHHQSFVKLPLLLPSINMRTDEGPMHEAVSAARRWEERPQIVAATVFGGYPYSDIQGAGASVTVVSTDPEMGKRCCRELGQLLWHERERYRMDLPGPAQAVTLSQQEGRRRPVVLADIADNPLSGGSADTTGLLAEVLQHRGPKTLVGALYDEEVVDLAMASGEGTTIRCELGGKVSPEFGGPVNVQARVARISNGRFLNIGPINTGLQVDVGGAVHLKVGGTDIVVTKQPITANDPELFGHLGLDVTKYDLLVLKVKNHFRAAFEPLVGDIIYVDAPGVASNDFSGFPFRNLPKGLWPLDPAASFEAEVTARAIPTA